MSYIYMEHPFLMFLDHTQRRSPVGRTPLDEWSARRRDLYLTTHDTHNKQISMPPAGFEPKISAGERQGRDFQGGHKRNYTFACTLTLKTFFKVKNALVKSAQCVMKCVIWNFVWIWEQTAIIYMFCVDRRTNIDYLCFVWIGEQTAIIYVFCVDRRTNSDYLCFVWIGEKTAIIYVFCVDQRTNSDYLCVLCGSQNKQRLFMCFVWISEQTAIIYVFCVDLRTNSHYFPIHH